MLIIPAHHELCAQRYNQSPGSSGMASAHWIVVRVKDSVMGSLETAALRTSDEW